jgi:hypothetical protein
MSKAPPIPPEQRSFHGQRPDLTGAHHDRPEEGASSSPRSSGVRSQGRHGALSQNSRNQGYQQDR